jgi:hypothetical protein
MQSPLGDQSSLLQMLDTDQLPCLLLSSSCMPNGQPLLPLETSAFHARQSTIPAVASCLDLHSFFTPLLQIQCHHWLFPSGVAVRAHVSLTPTDNLCAIVVSFRSSESTISCSWHPWSALLALKQVLLVALPDHCQASFFPSFRQSIVHLDPPEVLI